MLIDFGCAVEVNDDMTLGVAASMVRMCRLDGNQLCRAPELMNELTRAKDEVSPG